MVAFHLEKTASPGGSVYFATKMKTVNGTGMNTRAQRHEAHLAYPRARFKVSPLIVSTGQTRPKWVNTPIPTQQTSAVPLFSTYNRTPPVETCLVNNRGPSYDQLRIFS